jgi:hypothetical protein
MKPFALLITVMIPLLTMTIAFPLQLATAAEKIFHFKQQNVRLTDTQFTNYCGTVDELTLVVRFAEVQTAVWDNGHVVVSFVANTKVYDAEGDLIATQHVVSPRVTGEGVLPFSYNDQITVACTGNSESPGLGDFTIHFGFTIGEDGEIKELHITPDT